MFVYFLIMFNGHAGKSNYFATITITTHDVLKAPKTIQGTDT